MIMYDMYGFKKGVNMKKYFVLFILLCPTFFFIGWIGILLNATDHAQMVEVPITGYDPRDILRGHYLRYQIDNRSFYRSDYPECQLPKGSNNRYFIPEKEAPVLDKLFRQNRNQFSIVFLCRKGHKAIAKELLINGHNWRDVIKER